MKRIIIVLICVLVCSAKPVLAKDAGVGGEFRGGGSYGLTPMDQNDLLHRYGFDASAGIYVDGYEKPLSFAISVFLNGLMNEEQMYRFGFRYSLGIRHPDMRRLNDLHINVTWGLLQMAITSNEEVMWTPEVGLDLQGSIVFVRPTFTGYIGHEMGYGLLLVTGLSWKIPFSKD